MSSELPGSATRVLVVSDDSLARAGLVAWLREVPGVSLVGERSGPPLPAADVIVWDLGHGRSLEPLAAHDGAPVLALVPDDELGREALAAGAHGVLSRTAGPEVLAAALGAVAHGLFVSDHEGASQRAANGGPPPPPLLGELTPREVQVLKLLAEGRSNKEIAQALGFSEHTAKFHVNAILQKLGVERRTEAVVRAARLGLVML